MKKNKKSIVILGADGMVGQTIFAYLNKTFPNQVWGTTRHKSHITNRKLYLSIESYQKDFTQIQKALPQIDYVINCIAVLKNWGDLERLIYTNALFPHFMENLAEKNNFILFHISSDGVFSPLVGKVTESSLPSPSDLYGSSKLLGETTSQKAITFRSSFLGLDPHKHRGLLETIKITTQPLFGFTNQQWTGATSLQFAQLCKTIIEKNLFGTLRKKSPLYHFAPIGPVSKYVIISMFAKLINKKSIIKKGKGEKRTRVLRTNHFDSLSLNEYTNDIEEALHELLTFESYLIKNS